jgi:hypothetical protein
LAKIKWGFFLEGACNVLKFVEKLDIINHLKMKYYETDFIIHRLPFWLGNNGGTCPTG